MTGTPVRRRVLTGLVVGAYQAQTYLETAFIGTVAVYLSMRASALDWISAVAYVVPTIAGLLGAAAADRFGGRRAVLVLAGVTLVGDFLLTAGGVARELPVLAGLLAGIGLCLMTAAARFSTAVSAVLMRDLAGDAKLRESTAIRRFTVIGASLVCLPAGWVAERWGVPALFAAMASLLALGLLLMAHTLEREPRPPHVPLRAFVRAFARCFRDRHLLLVAAGAFMAFAAVFAYVAGVPVRLGDAGLPVGWVGIVLASGAGAALFVARPKVWSSPRFSRFAGATPVVALLVLAVAGQLVSAVAYAVVFALTTVAIELSRHWSQSLALLQAQTGRAGEDYHRRQAVVNLGGNLGAGVGAWLGRHAAIAGELTWLALLLVCAASAWALHRAWLVLLPVAWLVRRCNGRAVRWCYRGREYIVLLGDLAGFVYAAPRRDDTMSGRWLASFDPRQETLEKVLGALRPGRRWSRACE